MRWRRDDAADVVTHSHGSGHTLTHLHTHGSGHTLSHTHTRTPPRPLTQTRTSTPTPTRPCTHTCTHAPTPSCPSHTFTHPLPHDLVPRQVLTVLYDGTILDVDAGSEIFGFPSSSMRGRHVAELLGLFSDWRGRSGGANMRLLMLALLDKESEAPGAAWRTTLISPGTAQQLALGHDGGPDAGNDTRRSVVQQGRLQPKLVAMQVSAVGHGMVAATVQPADAAATAS
eukprot:54611-Chlamydomonas_euryale.AAC.1